MSELTLDELILKEALEGKTEPFPQTCARHAVRSRIAVSERRACRIVGQARATQRRGRRVRDDEAALTSAIERLAMRYGRYGYRRIRGCSLTKAGV